MTEDRGEQALTLFEQARELEGEAREELLARECAADRLLRIAVERLLHADARPHALLDRTPVGLADGEGLRGGEGGRLGQYSVEREIGRGGMGVVYLATRDDVDMRVALKLLSARYASPELVRRFHRERKILASLEHPHIARFLDTGVAGDGSPWLAMEYVEGRPILDWCRDRGLDLEARLELFEKVAGAVGHAHRRLLVHRDIKPANVLVTDDGEPKLLDFGIAKILDDAAEEELTGGQGVAGPMTPRYASPEQLRGEPITTASDIYQLGILLHLLLTGRRPMTAGGRPLSGLDRIQGLEPVAASRAIRMPVAARGTEGLCESSGETALPAGGREVRGLAGDLDTIVATALRADPAERYESAALLVEDLRLHRAHRPILARAPSIPYRIGKFVRRHRAATSMGAVALLVAMFSAGALAIQAGRIADERDRAREVAAVLETLVASADPSGGGGGEQPSRDVVAGVAAEAHAGLADDPETWGRILLTVGRVYRNLGEPDSALFHWRAALAALEPGRPASDPTILGLLGQLGAISVESGDLDGGMAYLERAVLHVQTLPEDRRAEVASALIDLGFGRQVAGVEDEAEALYGDAFAVLESLPDSGGNEYDRASVNLAYLIRAQGRLEEAERLFRRTVERRTLRLGPGHGSTLNAGEALASTLLALGRTDEAARVSGEVLAARAAAFEPPHQDLAASLELEARIRLEEGRVSEAERLAREALAMTVDVYGETSLRVPYARMTLSWVVAADGRIDEARAHQQEALRVYREQAGPEHPATLMTAAALARTELDAGRLDGARTLYESSLPRLVETRPEDPALVPHLAGWSELLGREGRCEEARVPVERVRSSAQPGLPGHDEALRQVAAVGEACGFLPD